MSDGAIFDVEAAILGAALCDERGAQIVLQEVTENLITYPPYRLVLTAIRAVLADGMIPDVVTVGAHLRAGGKMDDVGGATVLGNLVSSSGAVSSLPTYIGMLKSNAARMNLLNAMADGMAAVKSNEPGDVSRIIDEITKHAEAAYSPQKSKLPAFLDLNEILAMPPEIPWLIPQYIARGDLAVLGAQYGTGKTWLALDMALAVASGRQWLNFEPAAPGPVLYIDAENPLHLIRTRLSKLLGDGQLPPNLYYLHFPSIRIDDPAGARTLNEIVGAVKPALVIFDTLSKFHSGNEDKANEMTRALVPLLSIARHHDAAILLLHHYGKNDGTKTTHQLLRGSSAIGDNADQIFALQRGKGGLRLSHVKARHDVPAEQVIIQIKDEGPFGTHTKVMIADSGPMAELEDGALEVLSFIRSSPNRTRSRLEIKKECIDKGISDRTLIRYLRQFMDLKMIEKVHGETDGRETKYQATG